MTYSVATGPCGWGWVVMTVRVLLLVGLPVGAYLPQQGGQRAVTGWRSASTVLAAAAAVR
jgi:hypothetical protein